MNHSISIPGCTFKGNRAYGSERGYSGSSGGCVFLSGACGGSVFENCLWLANADIGNVYDQFQRFLGILTGGLGCLFFMGIFMKRVNGFGATCGLVANYVVCFGLDRLQFAGKPHLLLYGFLGMIACLIVAPIASMIRKNGAAASSPLVET